MQRIAITIAVGIVTAAGLMGTAIAPEEPTPEACEAVEAALADWSSYSDAEQEDLIVTGNACTIAYPEEYGPSDNINPHDPNAEENCLLFGSVYTACVWIGAVGAGLPLSSCLPPRPQAHSCYEPHAWIGGRSQAATTAGDADTTLSSVGLFPSCSWDPGDSASCESPESVGATFWFAPSTTEPCFTQAGQVVVYEQVTPIQTYVIPNGFVTHAKDGYCS